MLKLPLNTSIDNFSIEQTRGVLKVADRIELNLALLAFYRSVNYGVSKYNLVGGMMDEYEDETGVDTGSCANQVYDAVNHLYHPSGSYNNMTLQSAATVPATTPDDIRMIVFEEDISAITLNTDLMAYVSRDDGAVWVQVTLEDSGDYSSGKRILTGMADLKNLAVTSAYSVKYKLVTANSKNLNIRGVSLNW